MGNANTISVLHGPAGHVEVITLNPKEPSVSDNNYRYVLSGRALEFKGLRLETVNGPIDVEYGIIKINLAPDDTRSVAELEREDLLSMNLLIVNDEGEVYDIHGQPLDEYEKRDLSLSMQGCELSLEVPDWA